MARHTACALLLLSLASLASGFVARRRVPVSCEVRVQLGPGGGVACSSHCSSGASMHQYGVAFGRSEALRRRYNRMVAIEFHGEHIACCLVQYRWPGSFFFYAPNTCRHKDKQTTPQPTTTQSFTTAMQTTTTFYPSQTSSVTDDYSWESSSFTSSPSTMSSSSDDMSWVSSYPDYLSSASSGIDSYTSDTSDSMSWESSYPSFSPSPSGETTITTEATTVPATTTTTTPQPTTVTTTPEPTTSTTTPEPTIIITTPTTTTPEPITIPTTTTPEPTIIITTPTTTTPEPTTIPTTTTPEPTTTTTTTTTPEPTTTTTTTTPEPTTTTTTTTTIEPYYSCRRDNSFELFENKCYWFSSSKKTKEDSQKDCQSKGGHLLRVNSASVNSYILGHINENTWFDLSDTSKEGTFKYSDGSKPAFTYWGDNEPSGWSWAIWQSEDCVHYDPDKDMKWNDETCSDEYKYVCEFSAELVTE